MEPTVSSLVLPADAPSVRVRSAHSASQIRRDAAAATPAPGWTWTWRPLFRAVAGGVGVVYLFPLAILAIGLPIAIVVSALSWVLRLLR